MKVLIDISDLMDLAEARGKLLAALTGDFHQERTMKVVQDAYNILEKINPLKDATEMYDNSGKTIEDRT